MPFLPFLNKKAPSNCLPGTADSRADDFFTKLQANKYFARNQGLDHVLFSNHWNLEHLLGKVGQVVSKKFAFGVYEDNDHTSEVGSCRFTIPYVENEYCYSPEIKRKPLRARSKDFMFHGNYLLFLYTL